MLREPPSQGVDRIKTGATPNAHVAAESSETHPKEVICPYGPATEVGWGTETGITLNNKQLQLGFRYIIRNKNGDDWSLLMVSKGAAQHYADRGTMFKNSYSVSPARIARREDHWSLFYVQVKVDIGENDTYMG